MYLCTCGTSWGSRSRVSRTPSELVAEWVSQWVSQSPGEPVSQWVSEGKGNSYRCCVSKTHSLTPLVNLHLLGGAPPAAPRQDTASWENPDASLCICPVISPTVLSRHSHCCWHMTGNASEPVTLASVVVCEGGGGKCFDTPKARKMER